MYSSRTDHLADKGESAGAITLVNFQLLDVANGVLRPTRSLTITGDRITAIDKRHSASEVVQEIDLAGRTLMPGLIDCHVHICADAMTSATPLYNAVGVAKAEHLLFDMLMRGFTTVRDAGGADAGYRKAIETGLFIGPRLLVSGRPLSQTGGHGDPRLPSDQCPSCVGSAQYFTVADGVDAVRRAAREEIRRGADHIKVMASGGVSSPSDPIDYVQYSMEELDAIADEARRAKKYMLAHAYTAEAIKRAVVAGARSIEHGNFLDDDCAKLMCEKGVYLVPTLVAYHRVVKHGKERGVPDLTLEKAKAVLHQGTRSLEIAQKHGVKIAFGTDLFNAPKEYQTEEFLIRSEVQSNADIIRSATKIAAELLNLENEIGTVDVGYVADLIAVDGNPFEDFGCLQDQGKHIPLIVKAGRVIKNRITG